MMIHRRYQTKTFLLTLCAFSFVLGLSPISAETAPEPEAVAAAPTDTEIKFPLDITWVSTGTNDIEQSIPISSQGSSISKKGGIAGWDCSANGNETLTGDGTLVCKLASKETYGFFGLSDSLITGFGTIGTMTNTVGFQQYADAEYFFVAESAGDEQPKLTYAEGDVMAITRTDGTITLHQNGKLVHTYVTKFSGPMHAFAIIYSPDGLFTNCFFNKILPVAPVASDGTLKVKYAPTTGTLMAVDEDTPTLVYSIVTKGTQGMVTITNAQTGAYTYRPNATPAKTDSFTFQASDGLSNSNIATVNVTIELK